MAGWVAIRYRLRTTNLASYILGHNVATNMPTDIGVDGTMCQYTVTNKVVRWVMDAGPRPTTTARSFLAGYAIRFPQVPFNVLFNGDGTSLRQPANTRQVGQAGRHLPR